MTNEDHRTADHRPFHGGGRVVRALRQLFFDRDALHAKWFYRRGAFGLVQPLDVTGDDRHPVFGLDNRHLSGIMFNDAIFCEAGA